jgi:hypothetical protein
MLMRYHTTCCRRLLVFSCRYTRFAPQNPGRKLASGRDYVLVGGLFEVHTHALFHLSLSFTPFLFGSLSFPPHPHSKVYSITDMQFDKWAPNPKVLLGNHHAPTLTGLHLHPETRGYMWTIQSSRTGYARRELTTWASSISVLIMWRPILWL